jgi:hypothetical protein
MKDETQIWLRYADENIQSARILLENNLFNPCLQNLGLMKQREWNDLSLIRKPF